MFRLCTAVNFVAMTAFTAPRARTTCSAMIRTLLIATALLVAPLAPAAAQTSTQAPAKLSADEQKALKRVETYLNDLDTMKSRFLQLSSGGGQAEGTIWLDRPGGLRIEYDDPTPVLIVADGKFLNYWDRELKQATYLQLEETPAAVLVQEDLSFSDDKITVTDFEQARGVVRVTVLRTERPHEGNLTFVFEADPLKLRKWVVVDAQGVTTEVSLLDPRFGMELKKDLFRFSAPLYEDSPG